MKTFNDWIQDATIYSGYEHGGFVFAAHYNFTYDKWVESEPLRLSIADANNSAVPDSFYGIDKNPAIAMAKRVDEMFDVYADYVEECCK